MTTDRLIVTKRKALSRQVCVPADWSDEKATAALNRVDLCGTEQGWMIRRTEAGDPTYKPRVVCEMDPERVHIVFDA